MTNFIKNKALRSHHRWRKIQRTMNTVMYRCHFEDWSNGVRFDDGDTKRKRTLRSKFAITPAPCSCWMCGNPRKFFSGKDRLTLAERRAANDEAFGWQEWQQLDEQDAA